jgi:carbamoyltransferase
VTILGIWDGHDSGAACLRDGRLVAAVNEERLTRRKLEISFPSRAIHACLAEAGQAPADVSLVAVSTSDPAKALGRLVPWTKERYYRVRRRQAQPGSLSDATMMLKRWMAEWRPNPGSRAVSRLMLRRRLDAVDLGRTPLKFFDHHLCHGLPAAIASGFPQCAVVTIDGLGDGVSASIRAFDRGRIRLIAETRARDSLGVFFEQVTQLLNMRELEDEGKVMALADYAAAVADADNPLLPLLGVRDGRIEAREPVRRLGRTLRRILWSYPNETFARLAQRTVECVCLDLVRAAVALTDCRRVALSGGVVSNVKANRLIRLLPEVEDVYVFPHMGDGGLALGAAAAAHAETGAPLDLHLDSLALGPSYSDEAIEAAILRAGLSSCRPADLAGDTTDRLLAGQIVCWYQGRMEYGPRALGQRSVLARPDSIEIKNRLNLVLKRRVWYQPFCPSVLESEAPRLFEDWTPAGRGNRAMTMAYLTKPEHRVALSGVINLDGSCRPQLVPDGEPTPFAQVLERVKTCTGVGAILNTSFNIHSEPLVCSPDEAVDVFLRSGADALVIGPLVVARTAGAGRPPADR